MAVATESLALNCVDGKMRLAQLAEAAARRASHCGDAETARGLSPRVPLAPFRHGLKERGSMNVGQGEGADKACLRGGAGPGRGARGASPEA